MSPRQAINRFHRLLEKCGAEKVARDNRFKQERELLWAAVLLMGISKVNGEQYWLRPGEDISPDIDIRAVRYDNLETGEFGKADIDIQVTDFESHSNHFSAVIRRKMQKTPFRENLELLVSIREKEGQQFYPQQIVDEMKKIHPGFRTIWFVVDDATDKWKYHLVKVWPHMERFDYNVEDEFQRQVPPDWLRLKRGSRDELKQVTEEFDLPLPEC